MSTDSAFYFLEDDNEDIFSELEREDPLSITQQINAIIETPLFIHMQINAVIERLRVFSQSSMPYAKLISRSIEELEEIIQLSNDFSEVESSTLRRLGCIADALNDVSLQPQRQALELHHFFNLSSETLISTSRNLRLEPLLADYFYTLDNLCDRLGVGRSTFFRALTFFHQLLYINQQKDKYYQLEQYLIACLLLASYLEEDSVLYIQSNQKFTQITLLEYEKLFTQKKYKKYMTEAMYDSLEKEEGIVLLFDLKDVLASEIRVSISALCACKDHILKRLNYDLYCVNDLYDHYTQSLYFEHTLSEHQQFSAYLALIRCDYRFTAFDNKMLLSALQLCLFNKKSNLLSNLSQEAITQYEYCKARVSNLIYQLPTPTFLPNEEDRHQSLSKGGVSFESIDAYLKKQNIVTVRQCLTQRLPEMFLKKIKEKDEYSYQLFGLLDSTYYSKNVLDALNRDTLFQNFVLSQFDIKPLYKVRKLLLSLNTHIGIPKTMASCRYALFSAPFLSAEVINSSEQVEDECIEGWELVPFLRVNH